MVLPLVINGDGVGSALDARPGPGHGPFWVGVGSRIDLDQHEAVAFLVLRAVVPAVGLADKHERVARDGNAQSRAYRRIDGP
jgi:hypothetical protein